jgi:hypothetical protein
MLEGKVIELKPKRIFSLDEITELLPIVLRITKQYSEKVNQIIQKLDQISSNEKLVSESETQINDLIHEWQIKLEKLGGHTKGLWIADFDSGDGYFCWKYPEAQILYWHGYRDGFSGRRPVKEYLNSKQDKVNESGLSSDKQPHL